MNLPESLEYPNVLFKAIDKIEQCVIMFEVCPYSIYNGKKDRVDSWQTGGSI